MKMKIKYKKSKARKFPRTEGCKSAKSKDLLSTPHNKGRDPLPRDSAIKFHNTRPEQNIVTTSKDKNNPLQAK